MHTLREDREEEKQAIMKIIEGSKGPSVPIRRKGGAFVIEIDVMKDPEEGFSPAKKIFKPKNIKADDMDIDAVVKGAWEAFWDCQDCESTFHRPA